MSRRVDPNANRKAREQQARKQAELDRLNRELSEGRSAADIEWR